MLYQNPIDNGKYLYHFTKTETALLYVLPSRKLKLNSILESNDPKENKTFGFWSILLLIDDIDYSTIKQSYKDYLSKNCKQLCFSLDYFNKGFSVPGYRHPTMWAHYANNSKGVCLVFDKALFIKENNNLINDKIVYKQLLDFPQLDGDAWKKEMGIYFEKFVKNNSKKLFFHKHYHWRIEHEYKFIGIDQPEYCSIENSLIGIYLGPDFDHKLDTLVLTLMAPYKGQVEKIFVNDGEFYSIRIDDPDHED